MDLMDLNTGYCGYNHRLITYKIIKRFCVSDSLKVLIFIFLFIIIFFFVSESPAIAHQKISENKMHSLEFKHGYSYVENNGRMAPRALFSL